MDDFWLQNDSVFTAVDGIVVYPQLLQHGLTGAAPGALIFVPRRPPGLEDQSDKQSSPLDIWFLRNLGERDTKTNWSGPPADAAKSWTDSGYGCCRPVG